MREPLYCDNPAEHGCGRAQAPETFQLGGTVDRCPVCQVQPVLLTKFARTDLWTLEPCCHVVAARQDTTAHPVHTILSKPSACGGQ